ncbi:ATPase family AAA domain-containing protein 5 isoform X2 [Manduca sexta]|uniref:AAA+ ATPase domain-containing protein n=2 Tax=Manduca sexta TaxID=7130 RepID=A0A921ZKI5_MANSE|nr:ATPase family AAA domain-containing protein 5 isoform X2 [Manduca sexta]XP_030033180.1 ATPase family AAA domain-containing protein 5 isoform X2 [Manduca sexta]KAG6459434.1 hypothetical protein O3G_MSEX011402 [Manduca sexta]KAG6459435.1 hypothetical protein O3G_MSEX011402 [Manduca sexta]KAG6459436.1 hypothetical protein O3G_MSEX011402 [Manduca sexta]
MTSLIDPVPASDEKNATLINKVYGKRHSHKCRHVLKSKENILRHKCNKALKRKLKKYKLRLDGKEDQDILDVSDILVNSLTLKSPGSKDNQLETTSLVSDRPKNYLFRMVRNKQSKIVNGNNVATISRDSAPLSITSSQEKKQTNAFKLLMDSRNKSIGSNSPGKEKIVEEVINEDIIERQNAKAKRILVLQKMSEAKGSLKKREMEECHEKFIEVQMKKRAEKFKNMLLNQEPKSHQTKERISKKYKKKTMSKVNNSSDTIQTTTEERPKKIKSLQLVNLFDDHQSDYEKESLRSNKEGLTKEDKEFLEKLSPSMKKKENMLCYFMKVEKEPEPSVIEDDIVIKVKLPSRTNRKVKNKKKQNTTNEIVKSCIEISKQNETNKSPILQTAPTERQKRKRNCGVPNQEVTTDTIDILGDTSNRPKRCTKKPVKYIDDFLFSSSDEELHIFTPKKKKHTDHRNVLQIMTPIMDTKVENSISSTKKPQKTEKVVSQSKKDVKLAPIFNTKQRPDAVLSEAKQKFLQSGVPEQLKKIIAQQKNNSIAEVYFHTVIHVQQNNGIANNISNINIPFIDNKIEDSSQIYDDSSFFHKMLHLESCKLPQNKWGTITHTAVNEILQHIKLARPKFPVFRTYRLLRDKRKGEFHCPNYLDLDKSVEVNNSIIDLVNENPDQLNWTDKYKAMSTNQIIGNFETVKELKKWLVSWTETAQRSKNKINVNSDSSDFYNSDTDSREGTRNVNNLLIITGPTGSGKTSSVYAVAADLAMKVIEVNASSKRTGKVMLQDLQEATQSHKVNRGANNLEFISKSQEINQRQTTEKNCKRGRPKKTVKMSTKKPKEPKSDTVNAPSGSQDITRTDTSLILIDDADIMFDQDDGFCSAITQLVHSSKRPVILVTSSLSCPHLQRFLQNGKILKMMSLMPQMLGTWLDIMCLADSGTCCLGAGARFLNHFNGDVRKTINCLQFYATSQTQTVSDDISSQVFDNPKLMIDDEKSNMSWVDQDDNEEKNIIRSDTLEKETDYLWNNYVQSQIKSIDLKFPLGVVNTWWNLPQILSLKEDKSDNARLESIGNVMDCLSVSDYYSSITPDDRLNIISDPWYTSESHSVSEQEDMHNYSKSVEICDEISYELINDSIINAQKDYKKSKNIDVDFPGMTVQRERDRIVSRHNNMSSYLNPAAVLDRRALALDYWASCRTICRIEKTKSDNYSKRNNRFCHYLKSVNILCKNESFDYLCDSLSLVKTKK